MKKTVLFLATGLLLFACNKNSSTQENEPITNSTEETATNQETTTEATTAQEPNGPIYGCGDCFPGLRGSWYQVSIDWDANKIHGIWYWDSENEKKEELIVLEQHYSEGEEISGYGGKMKFPSSGDVYDFGIVETNFNVSSGDSFYQYEQE